VNLQRVVLQATGTVGSKNQVQPVEDNGSMHNSPNLNRTEQLLNATISSVPVTAVPVTDAAVTDRVTDEPVTAGNGANSDDIGSSSSGAAHRNNWRSVSAATQGRMQQQHKVKHPHDMIERRIVSRMVVGD
jgi:hypothetical protein